MSANTSANQAGGPGKMQDFIVPMERHHQRLHNSFSFWFAERTPMRQNEKPSWEDQMKHVATFRSVEGFWQVYNHLNKPHMLASQSLDLHLFKQGIKPMWEDAQNRGGGKWVFRMKKGLASMVWEDLLFAVIGEQFDVGNEICGIVVSCRMHEDVVSIWNRTSANKDAKMKILDVLRTLIKVPTNIPIDYKRHDSSIEISVRSDTAPPNMGRERERDTPLRGGGGSENGRGGRAGDHRDHRDLPPSSGGASSSHGRRDDSSSSSSWRSDGGDQERGGSGGSGSWRNRDPPGNNNSRPHFTASVSPRERSMLNGGGSEMGRSDSMGSLRGHSPGGLGMMERSSSAGSYGGIHHRQGDRGGLYRDPRDRGPPPFQDINREGAGEAGLNAGPGSAYGFTSSSSRMKGGPSLGDRDHRDSGRNFDSFNRRGDRDRGFNSRGF